MNNITIISLALFFLSFVLTFIIRHIALKLKVIDVPNERSSHVIPTPRGGGLAIVIAWYIGISILFYFKLIEANLYYALMCGTLLAIISLIDDLIDLKPVVRLISQILTAIGAFIFLEGLNPEVLQGVEFKHVYFLYPLIIIGIVWFVNLYNFLDGIDGYVSVETILVSMALFVFTGNNICIILAVSVLGFLIWNWPKAKIFMGDVGSTQLGFILVVLGIYFNNNQEFYLFHWIILTSPFWFDATFTLYRRWKNKEKLSQAHKKHAYQRIVQAGFSHLKTDLYLIGINILLFLMVLLSIKIYYLIIPTFIICILFFYLLTKQIDKRKSF